MKLTKFHSSKLILHSSQYILLELGLNQNDFHFQFQHRSLSNLTEFAKVDPKPGSHLPKIISENTNNFKSNTLWFGIPQIDYSTQSLFFNYKSRIVEICVHRTESDAFNLMSYSEAQCALPNFLKARDFASTRSWYSIYYYLFVYAARIYIRPSVGF